MKAKFVLLSSTAKLPTCAHDDDVGYDLCCDEEVVLNPGDTVKVKTNVQFAGLDREDDISGFMKIESRSGLASKGIFVSGGIIDLSYTGELLVLLNKMYNPNSIQVPYKFSKGDKIAQLVFYSACINPKIIKVKNVEQTIRGSGGFGSTGQ